MRARLPESVVTRASGRAGVSRGTLGQRAGVAVVRAASWLASRLPQAPLHRLMHVAGAGWYLAAPRDRARARANLRRICTALVASGRASPRIAAAARDPHALERLVRSAFQHRARYYLEVAMGPRYTWPYLEAHMQSFGGRETLARLDRDFEGEGRLRPRVFVGMHLGATEMPILYLTQRHGLPTVAPMETIGNAPLQAYLARSRGALGVRLIPVAGSWRELRAALRRGDAVGIVGDRDVSGSGVVVDLFGHPAPIPIGPALLAIPGNVRVHVAAVRRVGWGEYAPRVIDVAPSGEGGRRERVMRFVEAQARAFESLVADAPEQWLAVFFDIWPDLADSPA